MLPDPGRKLRALWLTGATVLSLVCYYQLIFQTGRENFPAILFYYAVLSLIYLLIMKVVDHSTLKWAIVAALLVRICLLPAIPELSDDFYRFIWDGRLLTQGLSPYAELPSRLMQDAGFNQVPINQQLYQGMNSPDYFTVYPPLAQWIFFLAAWCFPDNLQGNLILIRSIIILFETGSFILGLRILKNYGISSNRILIYAWNPLVIVELTGNLHFEAVMIFFVMLAIYLLQIKRWKWSAITMSSAVAAKLIPLIFLPLLMHRLEWKKVISYWTICGLVVAGFFCTIWSAALWEGISSGLSLYFQKFEFNASIYYLVREIGYAFRGYNIIQAAGPLLALSTTILILLFSWSYNKKLAWPEAMIWALAIYLVLATTVHPWYITTLVPLAMFTNYRFPIAWSILVILSYSGYSETGFHENMLLVTAEYLFLAVVMFWDLRNKKVISQSYAK